MHIDRKQPWPRARAADQAAAGRQAALLSQLPQVNLPSEHLTGQFLDKKAEARAAGKYAKLLSQLTQLEDMLCKYCCFSCKQLAPAADMTASVGISQHPKSNILCSSC